MRILLALPVLFVLGCSHESDRRPSAERQVNVYTHRHYASDKALFEAFTEKTGIVVRVVQAGDDELMARMEAEGKRGPCDVLITADAGRLWQASNRGLLQPVESQVLMENVPAHLRDPEGHWFGLTQRARIVAYHKGRVGTEDLARWEDLTHPRWKGRILVRSSENVYNQSLLAAMVAHNGPEAAQAWASGIVANMARPPKGGDTDQLLALAEGIGDVAIVNSYYVGKVMAGSDPAQAKARSVIGVAFPSLGGHGVHINISGGGVARHAPDREAAIALLEFLSGSEAQRIFAEGNHEYPVKHDVDRSSILTAFGTFPPDTLNMAMLGRHNATALKVLEAAGWR